MARPTKKGLDFFPIDVNIMADRKVLRLTAKYSASGFAVYVALLGYIYKEEGYYIANDENLRFDLHRALNIDEEAAGSLIDGCISVGLFDKELSDRYGVLSSRGIQKQFVEVCKSCKRGDGTINSILNRIDEKYLLVSSIDFTDDKKAVSSEKKAVSSEKTNVISSESTQRKEKESKEKKTLSIDRERTTDNSSFSPEEESTDFINYLNGEFKESYPDQCAIINKFPIKMSKAEIEALKSQYKWKVIVDAMISIDSNTLKYKSSQYNAIKDKIEHKIQ